MVLATMCYYDAMNYPLTAFEVWKHLAHEDIDRVRQQYRKGHTVGSILDVLNLLVQDRRLVLRDGFYILPNREQLVTLRLSRNNLSVHKLRKMQSMMRILRFVPFVRQVWVTGRLAMKFAQNGSDLDVLIVLKEKRIWIGRLIVTTVVHLLGWRRHGKYTRDRLCLNYFITTNSLAISLDDRFSAHEYMMARCLFTSISPTQFLIANNWITRFRPHFDALLTLPSSYFIKDIGIAYFVRQAGEWLLNGKWLEQFVRRIQRSKIMRNPNTFKKGSMIVVNDQELIFLPNPHSPQIRHKYQALCQVQGL
jgi:hypothetical protein